ncbi:MAG: sensor histidine kinase [Solirubrobacteraceae bacterium]
MKRRRLRLLPLLVVGAGLLLSIAIVSRLAGLGAISKLNESNANFVRASQSLVLANNLEQRVIDLETGLRGYLLTGERSFLAPRSAALRVIPSLERRLQSERGSGDGDLATLRGLYALIRRYAYAYQSRVLALAARDPERARSVRIVLEGKNLVDRMRSIFARFVAGETQDAGRRRSAASNSVSRAEAIGLIGLVFVPVAIVLSLLWMARSIVAPVRRLASAADRIGEGDLQARVPEEGAAEVRDLASGFNTMAASLLKAERVKNEFFALVSHELRTPLTSIIGYIDLVQTEEAGEVSERQARYLGVIDRNARRLMRLVGDLLFVAQVEAGTLSLERGEVDLGTVAAEAVEAARPHADGKGVLLTLDTQPVELHDADRDRLGQLLDNLLTNALKFTDEGGRVEVRVRETQGKAQLQVSDSGVGIAHEELDRLFERFYRAQAATDAAVQGVGLGLSICKAIAETHGGSIAVASRIGEGTTFTVELPTAHLASKTTAAHSMT